MTLDTHILTPAPPPIRTRHLGIANERDRWVGVREQAQNALAGKTSMLTPPARKLLEEMQKDVVTRHIQAQLSDQLEAVVVRNVFSQPGTQRQSHISRFVLKTFNQGLPNEVSYHACECTCGKPQVRESRSLCVGQRTC